MLNIIGAGGHASVLADVARRAGFEDITIWSDDAPVASRFPRGVGFRNAAELSPSLPVVLGIGDLAQRSRLRERFPVIGPSVVDPSAIVGGGVKVAEGAVVFTLCVLNANASIGPDAIINTGCIVEHDCVVHTNAHLSPGVRLAGTVVVGRSTHIGTGAIVLPGVKVGDDSVVGAGAVVTRDVSSGVTVVGVPAKVLAHR